MNWRSEGNLVTLVQLMRTHRVFDPDHLKHGETASAWVPILRSAPFNNMGLLSHRPLYVKGLSIIRDYQLTLEAERYHTGGGQLNRPKWWEKVEKDLAILLQVYTDYFFGSCLA